MKEVHLSCYSIVPQAGLIYKEKTLTVLGAGKPKVKGPASGKGLLAVSSHVRRH
jgi:hypothetical protein